MSKSAWLVAVGILLGIGYVYIFVVKNGEKSREELREKQHKTASLNLEIEKLLFQGMGDEVTKNYPKAELGYRAAMSMAAQADSESLKMAEIQLKLARVLERQNKPKEVPALLQQAAVLLGKYQLSEQEMSDVVTVIDQICFGIKDEALGDKLKVAIRADGPKRSR